MVGKTFRMLACLFVAVLLVGVAMASIAAAADQVSVTGTLVQSDEGLVLKAEDKTYLLKGGELESLQAELKEAINKKVTITGEASTEGDKNLLAPQEYEIVE